MFWKFMGNKKIIFFCGFLNKLLKIFQEGLNKIDVIPKKFMKIQLKPNSTT